MVNTMGIYCKFIVALCAVFLAATTSSYTQEAGKLIPAFPDVTILQSDSRSVTFEYRLTDVQYDTLIIDSQEYTNITFFGGTPPERGVPERPDLHFRAITIAMPASENPKIEIIQRDYQTVRNVRIPPVGKIKRDEDDEIYITTEGDELPTDVDITIVDMYDIGKVRGVVLGTLHLYPVHLEAGGSAVRLYNRLVIRVTFGSGNFNPIDEYTFNTLLNTVLNIDQVPTAAAPRSRLEGTRTEPAAQQNSILADGPWYRITVESEGMYRIDASDLQDAGIPINTIDPGTIKLYGNGGRMLPDNIIADRPDDLVEIAIYVHGENDGSFDAGDYIVFYGTGTTYWEYNPEDRLYKHRYNYYTDKNKYFLMYGGSPGKRMQEVPSIQESNPIRPQYFVSSILHRNPRINLLGSGREWVGESFSPGDAMTFSNTLYGLNAIIPVRYRMQTVARAPTQTRFRIEDSGVNLGAISTPGVHLTSEDGRYASRSAETIFSRSGSLHDNRSELRFEYEAGAQSEGFLEWFEIHYPRRFEVQEDYLKFSSPDTTGVVEYNIQGFSSSQVTAYDITAHSSVKRITGAEIEDNSIRFKRQQENGHPSSFAAVAPDGYLSVNGLDPVDNSNLRGISQGAEFIIIAHPELLSEAERLKQHRESFTPNRLTTTLVDVNHIYNEFSGGLLDPTAIRDFLYHAYNSWQIQPRYVLLFGAGSYDYRRILGQRENYIPSWQTIESLVRISTYTTDDFFVQFSPNSTRPSLMIGRLNAINRNDARIMIDKIINYETRAEFGPWRNRITYIADNGWTPHRDEGTSHTSQSEQLARQFTPAAFEKEKIYMIQYPAENTALGRRMPEVNREIVNSFNRGTLIMNWTGHGNPRVWAHEWIFIKESTIPQLNNRDRLTFVTAATCDFSRLDDPREQSGGELLVSWENGGAVGVLSSSRIVYGTLNAQFNNSFYLNVLSPFQSGIYPRVGDAVFATKQIYNRINDIKFVLLGDPTIRLLIPTHNAAVKKINGESVVGTVTLKALQKITIEGTVRQPDGTTNENFNGRMFVNVYDSDKEVSIDKPRWHGFSFTIPGNVIFRGESSVTQGSYSSSFVVPKDISHEGGAGRIALYFWEDQADGRGFSRNIVLGGIDTTVTPDTEGPEIDIYLDNRNFRSGDLVSERPLLLVDLFDDSGINISGGGIGHRIEAWLNDGDGMDLTDYYTGAIDSYQKGSIEYQLDEIDPGPHHLRLRAWDVYNNSSIGEIFFNVATGDKLSIQNVYNYPNPFGRETVFTFQHNQNTPIDVEIKIYTVSGRMIAHLREYSINDRFVRIPWNGFDNDGDRIANGVYFYKVLARTVDGEFASEALGRMVVMR